MLDYFWFASSQLQTRRLSKYDFPGCPCSHPLLDIFNFLTRMTTVVWNLSPFLFHTFASCEGEVQSQTFLRNPDEQGVKQLPSLLLWF